MCRDTVEIPRDFNGGDGCDETPHIVQEGQAITTDKLAPAFLIEKKGAASPACYRLGLEANQQYNMNVELYDTTDLAMGLNIKYTEGDYCCPYAECDNSQYRQKSLTLSFRCSDSVSSIPSLTSVETSNNECDYKLYFLNVNACPTSRRCRRA